MVKLQRLLSFIGPACRTRWDFEGLAPLHGEVLCGLSEMIRMNWHGWVGPCLEDKPGSLLTSRHFSSEEPRAIGKDTGGAAPTTCLCKPMGFGHAAVMESRPASHGGQGSRRIFNPTDSRRPLARVDLGTRRGTFHFDTSRRGGVTFDVSLDYRWRCVSRWDG